MAFDRLVNFPKRTNFRFWCSEIPIISELVQDITIPTLTLGQAEIFNRFNDYPEPGEKLQFQEIDIGFVMDENYDCYAEVFSWMNRMAGVPGRGVVESERKIIVADLEITLLDNKQTPVRRFIFQDAWPGIIGAMPYDTQGEAETVQTIITFYYTNMVITPDTKNLTGFPKMEYNH